MALYINYKTEWHVGEPIPENLGRVVTFQADGDELEMIYAAMAPPSRLFWMPPSNGPEGAPEEIEFKTVVYGELARPENN
jgi:hypothetical protein